MGILEEVRGAGMNKTAKDIFRAIHEGKWMEIEYQNQAGQVTRYWIGILDLCLKDMSLKVEGLHIYQKSMMVFDKIFIESIRSSIIIEGTYQRKNEQLLDDIKMHPEKYKKLFCHVANLKILNYLAECNRLDTTPYYSDYTLLKLFDSYKLKDTRSQDGTFPLSEEQYNGLIKEFTKENQTKRTQGSRRMENVELGLNLLSVRDRKNKGLYVLAYQRLLFDVQGCCLRPDKDITICYEYEYLEQKQSVRRFLDAEDYDLLDHFEKNAEEIKNKIAKRSQWVLVDDMPYLIAIGRNSKLDLDKEYEAIADLYEVKEEKRSVPVPIQAFFGELTDKPIRRKNYPFALLNKKVNLDQLLAVHNGMKYPLTYVQGPPGTGKTSTIINTITTAFFNDRTVLFSSYNNHPIDSVFEELCSLRSQRYGRIPFPVVRLGNNEKVKEALEYMKAIYHEIQNIRILEEQLERNKQKEMKKAQLLSAQLSQYEEKLELEERQLALNKLVETQKKHLNFYVDLYDRQMRQLKERSDQIGEVSIEEVKKLLPQEEQYMQNYFYFQSARLIKRLDEPKNQELKGIILSDDDNRLERFQKYLSEEKNVEQFLRIFPIVITTCISAQKIGPAKQHFDMTILDEASQCNTAVSLVPIIRGKNLMLVGDPQQLNPVITLNPKTNEILKKMYFVTDEYDYIKNSIYKTYLACDSVSDEILLSHHYRCHRKIIEFNNRKYYNGKLNIDSQVKSDVPLLFMDVGETSSPVKNTSIEEAEAVVRYASLNKNKKIGVITPFASQKECIGKLLEEQGLKDVTCGTVHTFQGDEKDVILFSLAVTGRTGEKSYQWLKNNKELINVATTRAREQLILVGDYKSVERLHNRKPQEQNDLFELVQYVASKGQKMVTPRETGSRALGVKPYSTKTEDDFLENLDHALGNVLNGEGRCSIKKEVPVKQVFRDNVPFSELFYTGQFDFVVYQKNYARQDMPILAIELDGREHYENEVVQARDRKKEEICRAHDFELIRVDNSYARRYHYIRNILMEYFRKRSG